MTRKGFVIDEGFCENGLPYVIKDAGLKYTKLYYVNVGGQMTPFRSRTSAFEFLKERGVKSAAAHLRKNKEAPERIAADMEELRHAVVTALQEKPNAES